MDEEDREDDRDWAERQASQVEDMQCKRSHDERIATEWDSIQAARNRVERAAVELAEFERCRSDIRWLCRAVDFLCQGDCPRPGNHSRYLTCWHCEAKSLARHYQRHWEARAFYERREKAWAECKDAKAQQGNAS